MRKTPDNREEKPEPGSCRRYEKVHDALQTVTRSTLNDESLDQFIDANYLGGVHSHMNILNPRHQALDCALIVVLQPGNRFSHVRELSRAGRTSRGAEATHELAKLATGGRIDRNLCGR